jgi:hypothetical protein
VLYAVLFKFWQGLNSDMYGPENINLLSRAPSADLPDQLMIKISPSISKELGLREGQTVRGAVSENGQSITLGTGADAQSYSANLSAFKGQTHFFQLLKNAQGLYLKASEASSKPLQGSSSNVINENRTTAGPSRLVMLLSQSNSYQQVSLLNSGGKLAKILEKRTEGIGSNLSKIINAKASSISAQNVSNSLSLSGLLGSLVGAKNPQLAGVKNLAQELQAVKRDALSNGRDLGELQGEIDSSIDYLDRNKVDLLVGRESGVNTYRFMMTFGDFPSVEIVLKEIEEIDSTSPNRTAQSTSLSGKANQSMYQSVFNSTEVDESLVEGPTELEGEDAGKAADNIQEEYDKRREKGGSAGSKNWAIELDFQFSDNDKLSVKIAVRKSVGATAVVWASNEATLGFASSNESRLVASMENLGINLVSCQFLKGERPAIDSVQFPGKSNFVVES